MRTQGEKREIAALRSDQPFNRLPLVDLHTHVLPGVDDGARDDEESLRMLRIAEEEGIAVVAATPHAHRCRADRVVPAVERLNARARDAGLGVHVIPGIEARYTTGLPDRLAAGDLLTLNGGRHLLLELYLSGPWPGSLLDTIAAFHAMDVRPVLAHAERYPDVQRDPALVLDVIAAGVPVQINAESLAGRVGKGAQAAAEYLIAHHMAHLLASDAHDARAHAPRLRSAFDRAAELAGEDYARFMVATAASIARGEPLTLPEPVDTPGR